MPAAELYQYSTKLRSMTQGRGRFTFQFDHYEEVPREIQEKLVDQLRKDQAGSKRLRPTGWVVREE